jgi:hypothetical protein
VDRISKSPQSHASPDNEVARRIGGRRTTSSSTSAEVDSTPRPWFILALHLRSGSFTASAQSGAICRTYRNGPGRIEPATLGLKVPRNHSFSLPLFRPFRRRLRLVLGVYASLFVTSYESARCVHGALSSTLLIVAVNRSPRRLVHDADLVRRRAAGESLRTVAADYGVAHTTLSRYFARKDVAAQLRAARRALQAEGRAARAGRAAGRQIERTVRRQAKEEAALARSFSEIDLQPPGPRRSDFEAWLDERDARRPWLRQDLRTRSDDLAARTAEGGGGIDALIEATGLRTLENLVRRIDPGDLGARIRQRRRRPHPDPT